MIQLKKLKPRERLWLWQRRNNLSRRQTAAHFNVSEKTVTNWRSGRRGFHHSVELTEDLRPGEICALLRHRSGLSIVELAGKFGTSHVTFLKIERDDKRAEEELLPWWWAYLNLGEE